MHTLQLRLGRGFDHLPGPGDFPGSLRREFQSQRFGFSDHIEHTPPGYIHHDGTQLRHFDWNIQVYGEGRDIFKRDLFDFSSIDARLDHDQASGRIQLEPGYRFLDRHHTGLDECRNHTDGVGTGHRWILHLLHDDKTGIGFRVGRRQNQIAVGGGIAAWFTQHPQTQIVRLGREIAHFVEHGLTRYVQDTTDNDPTRLPAGVKINRLDHVG